MLATTRYVAPDGRGRGRAGSQALFRITEQNRKQLLSKGALPCQENLKTPTPNNNRVNPDQVVKWDNIINGKHPPKELRTLKSSNSLVISKHIHDFKPENALRKIDIGEDVSAWNLLPGHDLVFGLPLKTGGRLSQEELAYSKPAGGHLEAYRPEWADVIYHPKLSGGIFRKPMRRRNGRRVWPHFIFGPDSRQPFYPAGYPNQCIGRLFVWTEASSPNWQVSGTATLIGKNIIVTAGHLMPWGSNSGMVKLVPAYYNGFSTLGPSVFPTASNTRAGIRAVPPRPTITRS